MVVFVVEHVHEIEEDNESIKLIGVYSSEEKAQQAVARLRLQPGFRDTPEGFSVDRYTVDEDHWREGFFTTGAKT
jgi:hypothetical protein